MDNHRRQKNQSCCLWGGFDGIRAILPLALFIQCSRFRFVYNKAWKILFRHFFIPQWDLWIILSDPNETAVFYRNHCSVPASAPPPARPTWKPRSWTRLQRWRWDSVPWWLPGCLWRRGRRLTRAWWARWDPSSSSSSGVWVWASSCPKTVASQLSSERRKQVDDAAETNGNNHISQ